MSADARPHGRPLRLTFLLSSLRLSGGTRVIVEYANRLAARGHSCALVAPGGAVDGDLHAELADKVSLLESPVALRTDMSRLDLLRLSHSLAATAPRSDIILSTHTPTTVAGFIATRLMRKGRAAWFYQDYAAMFADRPAEAWLMQRALGWNEVAFVNSAWAGDEIGAQEPAKIVVTGVGISHAELLTPVYANQRVVGSPRSILTMGDMRPRKGLGDFLAAAEILATRIPDLHLNIVAKDPCTVETRLPYTLHLRPDRAELARLYQTCDLFVLASRWESFGLPPLEAMSCAAPVALVDSGGVRDYARDGENCLLTPPQDAPALAAAMERLLSDHALAQRLSEAGPPTAAQYDWEWLAARFEQQLLRLAGQNTPSPASRVASRNRSADEYTSRNSTDT